MSEEFSAIIAEQNEDGKSKASLRSITLDEVPDEDVLIDVAYSTVNYKDGLAVTGKGKICRSFPMVCGIDLSGTVVESRSDKWQAGDQVLVNGYGLSEDHWGGYALEPESFEFGQGRENRMHDRIRYRRDGAAWALDRLAP